MAFGSFYFGGAWFADSPAVAVPLPQVASIRTPPRRQKPRRVFHIPPELVRDNIISINPPYFNSGTGLTTVSVSPQEVGDLLVIGAWNDNNLFPGLVSISGGGVSNWQKVLSVPSSYGAFGAPLELWYGTVTTIVVGATVTLTWANPPVGAIAQIVLGEFQSVYGPYTLWTTDVYGSIYTNSPSSTIPYPTLTPRGQSELYFGYAITRSGAGQPGTPAADSWEEVSLGNLVVWNVNTPTGPHSPAGVLSGSPDFSDAIAAIFIASDSRLYQPPIPGGFARATRHVRPGRARYATVIPSHLVTHLVTPGPILHKAPALILPPHARRSEVVPTTAVVTTPKLVPQPPRPKALLGSLRRRRPVEAPTGQGHAQPPSRPSRRPSGWLRPRRPVETVTTAAVVTTPKAIPAVTRPRVFAAWLRRRRPTETVTPQRNPPLTPQVVSRARFLRGARIAPGHRVEPSWTDTRPPPAAGRRLTPTSAGSKGARARQLPTFPSEQPQPSRAQARRALAVAAVRPRKPTQYVPAQVILPNPFLAPRVTRGRLIMGAVRGPGRLIQVVPPPPQVPSSGYPEIIFVDGHPALHVAGLWYTMLG